MASTVLDRRSSWRVDKPPLEESDILFIKRMSESIPKGVFLANWAASKEYILFYLRAKRKPYQTPRLANKFGLKHLTHKGDTLFYKGLEIVTEPKRREKILEEQESAYGGSKAIYYRLRKKFIGITYRHVLSYLGESERRQLKQKKVSD